MQEASIAWEKRQAQVRAKLQQDKDAAAWNSWWENLGGECALCCHPLFMHSKKLAAAVLLVSGCSSKC
jgi:hypothetical protein